MEQALDTVPVGPLERARRGDAEALGDLLEPHLDTGYRLALSMLRLPDAAEDAVQESCFKAQRAVSGFRGDASAVRPWFLTIVANHCRSQLRRRHRGWLELMPEMETPDESPNRERHLDLRRELSRMRQQKDRLVLALFYYLDLPLAEVAQVMGVSESAARSRLYRAVAVLRERIGTTEDTV